MFEFDYDAMIAQPYSLLKRKSVSFNIFQVRLIIISIEGLEQWGRFYKLLDKKRAVDYTALLVVV
ncbi:hypothetical protein BGP76_02535 [Reichenbachiella sp. MSK19-1]|nr:hypothetical protein BGP76_02535 [Reichenbachiella sp. MSK19-1]